MGLSQLSSLKIIENTQPSLYLFHQNSRGIKHKMDELICMVDSCGLSPHIICLSEHYLIDHNLLMIKPNNYYLACRFLHQSYSGGHVYMHIRSNLESNMIDLSQYFITNVIEVCASKSKLLITLLYYYAYTDLVKILVNLLYNLI